MTNILRPAAKGGTVAAQRDTILNLYIPSAERSLIDRAAAVQGTTRAEFILRAARRAAEDTLLDQVMFSVGPEAYQDFLDRLDAPIKPNERMRRTMQAPSPWDPA